MENIKLRRSMLFIPGSNAGMLKNSYIYRPDAVMFDLEDSVSIREKDTARLMVFHTLKSIDYHGIERVVRINPIEGPYGLDDIEAAVRAGTDVIRLPKTETAQDVIDVERVIESVEKSADIKIGKTKILAAIEGPLGVVNAMEIAKCSKRLMGIALGAEDYVTNMHTTRSIDGSELFQARSQIVIAARAAGLFAFDTVFSDVSDSEGFLKEVNIIKQLGFDGKSLINPRQIELLHEAFTPSEKEIEKAKKIIRAIKEAETKGSGVVSLDGRMVDKPVVDRAVRAIALAKASGIRIEEAE